MRRDKECTVCGSKKGRVAHHKNSASYFEEERYDTDNGVCLCGLCHMNFHNNFKRSTKEKCTKYDFHNFLCLSKYFISIKE